MRKTVDTTWVAQHSWCNVACLSQFHVNACPHCPPTHLQLQRCHQFGSTHALRRPQNHHHGSWHDWCHDHVHLFVSTCWVPGSNFLNHFFWHALHRFHLEITHMHVTKEHATILSLCGCHVQTHFICVKVMSFHVTKLFCWTSHDVLPIAFSRHTVFAGKKL